MVSRFAILLACPWDRRWTIKPPSNVDSPNLANWCFLKLRQAPFGGPPNFPFEECRSRFSHAGLAGLPSHSEGRGPPIKCRIWGRARHARHARPARSGMPRAFEPEDSSSSLRLVDDLLQAKPCIAQKYGSSGFCSLSCPSLCYLARPDSPSAPLFVCLQLLTSS